MFPELGDISSALREFDEVLFHKVTPDNYLTLLDSTSLLWRLDIMGAEPGEERWSKVTDAMVTWASNFRSPWQT